MEWIIITILLGLALFPVLVESRRLSVIRSTALSTILFVSGIAGIVTTTIFNIDQPDSGESTVVNRPTRVKKDGYGRSKRCQSCHQSQHHSWSHSYHSTMTQVADEAEILGNFDQTLQIGEQRFILSHDDDGYWVELKVQVANGFSPLYDKCKVVMTTGSHHFQLYWYTYPAQIQPLGPKKMLGLLPFAYSIEEEKWIPRSATFLGPRHHVGNQEISRWNNTCIRCHTTHPRPHVDGIKVESEASDFGISCEACHGPGDAHIERFKNPITRYEAHLASENTVDDIVNPAKVEDHRRQSQICGFCHSMVSLTGQEHHARFQKHGTEYRPGDDLTKFLHLIRKTDENHPITQEILKSDPTFLEQAFWPDGMVRVTGREYTDLLESACHTRGKLTCLSCHSMHHNDDGATSLDVWKNDQLRPELKSDMACLQCHDQFKEELHLKSHTHHSATSSGSRCYNCHMPHTTYGLLGAVRSHQITSPAVQVTVETGRLNACNLCHLDKTLGWAADHLTTWYDHGTVDIPEEYVGVSAVVKQVLSGDAAQRAIAAWAMGWSSAHEASGSKWIPMILKELLNDPYEALQIIAIKSFRNIPTIASVSFDLLNASASFEEVTVIARNMWNQSEKVQESNNAILTNPDGTFSTEGLRMLMEQRDERRIILAE